MNSDLLFLGNKSTRTKILAFICLICISFSLFYLVSLALLSPLFGIPLVYLTEAEAHLDDPGFVRALEFLQIIQAFGLFIVPGLLFSYLAEKKLLSYPKLNVPISFMSVLIVFTLILSVQPVINFIGELNSKIHLPDFLQNLEDKLIHAEEFAKQITETFLKMNGFADYLIVVIMMVILPAIGEELLFRGIIQSLLKEWTKNAHWGIFITAFLFSAIHMQFLGFIPRLVLGMILGYLFEWSGSLWLPIAAHFINNGSAILADVLQKKGMLNFNPDKIGLGENNLVVLIVSFGISALLLFRLSQAKSPAGKDPGV